MYLKQHSSFVLCTFFSKGEELGALYEDDGILRIAGLYADNDLKPVSTILKFGITKGCQKLVNEKFDKLKKDDNPSFVLKWRDYVNHTLETKCVTAKAPVRKPKVINEEVVEKDLMDMFGKV